MHFNLLILSPQAQHAEFAAEMGYKKMNFIFDIGNVILSFKPEIFLKGLWDSETQIDIINKIVFTSMEWILLDKGIITHEEAVNRMCSASPENEGLIRKTMECYQDMFVPLDETVAFLYDLKKQNQKLYYLSNFHKKASEWIIAMYPFFSLFDGGIFSCDVHLLKPDLKIYHLLLEKYKLESEMCIFMDDTEENVIAAKEVGINGIHFFTVSKAKEELKLKLGSTAFTVTGQEAAT